jgi:dihydrofolate synthase/folylpolyglutamate synthase
MIALAALARLERLPPRGMRLGLGAIDSVCERLGRPERRVPSTLIAGTNGKGSTAAMLSAVARAAGVRAGLYTSPHLTDVTERLRIGDGDVGREELDAALARVFAAADAAPEVALTYFEAITAAAFVAFAARELELAILEVGLGGRLDATNVAPARVSVVTSIGLDHMEELGPTLARIAAEKAGVFRTGRPALGRASDGEAREALERAARAAGAEWHDAGEEIRVEPEEIALDGTRFRLETPSRRAVLRTRLPGEHQAWNGALAVRAAELLSAEAPALARPDALAAGLAAVRWPGRLESFERRGRRVLLDGCHNPEGAEALARFLDQTSLAKDFVVVFGAMADKDVEGIAARLLPRARSVYLAPAQSSRSASAEELARRVAGVRDDAVSCAGIAEALGRALSADPPAPIIVAGSLYLVGEARARLLSEEHDPA